MGAGRFGFNPRSKNMTARDERVVWTVPGAASDRTVVCVPMFGALSLSAC